MVVIVTEINNRDTDLEQVPSSELVQVGFLPSIAAHGWSRGVRTGGVAPGAGLRWRPPFTGGTVS